MTKAWRCLGGLWLQTRRGYYAEAIEHGPVLQVGLDKCGASVDWQIQFAGLCCRRLLFKVWSRWEVTRFGRALQKWNWWKEFGGNAPPTTAEKSFFSCANNYVCVFWCFFSFSASRVSGRVLLNGRLYVAGLFPWWPAMWENNSEETKNPAFN